MRQQILNYAETTYHSQADSPFKRSPETIALRHPNQKWYGLLMTVSQDKLGLDTDETIDLLTLKLAPELVDILRQKEGYFPAYHMNKEHWLSIALDGRIPFKEVCALLDDSYYLTK